MAQRNNLDAVRLAAASMVLFGHSFALLGQNGPLFLSWTAYGSLGVHIFFIISGYLVSESWDRDPHLLRFFQRRLLRILPGLAVCVLLSILVLGPLMTTLPVGEYLRHRRTWEYLQNIALSIVYYLPGVFEHTPVANAVNGSLWSLPVEFLMYIVVALVGVLHGNRWVVLALAACSAVGCLLWAQVSTQPLVVYNFDLRQAFIYGTYFWVGACFQRFGLRSRLSLTWTLLAMVAMACLANWTAVLAPATWVLLPVVVLGFGFAHSTTLARLTASGDYSYGIYIYAFPVQQTVVYLRPDIGIVAYMIICALGTLVLAVASWHLVERRALRFKPAAPKPLPEAPLAADLDVRAARP